MEPNSVDEQSPLVASSPAPPTLAGVLARHDEDTVDEDDPTIGVASDDLPIDNQAGEERDRSKEYSVMNGDASDDLPIDNRAAEEPEQSEGRRLRTRKPREEQSEVSEKRRKTRKSKRLWEEPLDEDTIEKSSANVHTCPLCKTIRKGYSSLWSHLANAHNSRLNDVGRWVHCETCDGDFTCESSWRQHLDRMECPQASMSVRWREKRKREEGEGEETHLVDGDASSESGLDLQQRKRRKTVEEGMIKEKRKRDMVLLRPYMRPLTGRMIVRQATDFPCPACDERDFPTIPSLVHHQRKVHSMQLSEFETWVRCVGCGQDFTALTTLGAHLKSVGKEAEEKGENPECEWSRTELSWQVEETSEEARRFLAGLPPAPSSSEANASSIKQEPLESDGNGGEKISHVNFLARRRKHKQRIDMSYTLPRKGYEIVRRQTNVVCRMCGEVGFPTCSSVNHHIREMHKAGIHQAGMWLHCARCLTDFSNMTSARTHVAVGDHRPETCDWQHIYTCWHEVERAEGGGGEKESDVKIEEGEDVVTMRWNEDEKERLEDEERPGTSGYERGRGFSPREGEFPGLGAARKRHFKKQYKPPAKAQEGFEIVKRTTDLPCFGCDLHYSSLTTFIWCMQGKHRMYFSDVGAWLECACGRVFMSTTALRVHVRVDGAESGCGMESVSLCWQQRIGGRETETPCYAGAPPPDKVPPPPPKRDVYGSALRPPYPRPRQGWNTGYSTEPRIVRLAPPTTTLVPAPTPRLPPPTRFVPAAVLMARERMKSGSEGQRANEGRGAGGSDERVNGRLEGGSEEGEERMDGGVEGGEPGNDLDPDAGLELEDTVDLGAGTVVKEEEAEAPLDFEAALIGAAGSGTGRWMGPGWPKLGRNGEEEEGGGARGEARGAGESMARFDPTGYADGDRFVLRKTGDMSCRICGVPRQNPRVLAAHLQLAHEDELRGARSDWPAQHWLECAACLAIFHSAQEHLEHLEAAELRRITVGKACSMADARLCWMEREE